MAFPGWNIKAEFNKNKHSRGVLSMARSQAPDSASSQFFIVLKDSTFIDGYLEG
jgi:cyclophilin family peptidyl-prolyl cis-trans isomerase